MNIEAKLSRMKSNHSINDELPTYNNAFQSNYKIGKFFYYFNNISL
jgi:hypothetical protein